MSKKNSWIVVIISCLAVFAFIIPRDIGMEKQYAGDLRNRIVGARLIHNNRSPYFFKWTKGDGILYYDPANFDSLRSSNITSSPFLHHLFLPLAEFPEYEASRIWLLIEYILLLGILAIALSMANSDAQRWAVLLMTMLFLLTQAWRAHIAAGQIYIVIPFLSMLFLRLIRNKKTIINAVAAGIAAAFLVLIKPNAILFFIPFLFLIGNFPRAWLLAFFTPAVLLCAWILISDQEFGLWKDYQQGVVEQVKLHQQLQPALQQNEPDPNYTVWEGIDMNTVRQLEKEHPTNIHSENGNVFVIAQNLFHRKLSVALIGVAALGIVLMLTGIYAFRRRRHFRNRRSTESHSGYRNQEHRRNDPERQPRRPSRKPGEMRDLSEAAILGFCLYMVSDLFSPIYRHQYYTLQWICPVLIATSLYNARRPRIYVLLLAGLLLNIFHFGFVKMGNTIGEYLILAVLIVFSLLPRRSDQKYHHQ
jgi:hypothetical protein